MPRIAFFPDSFHEVNGVAHTARNFQEFARRHKIPMLCVRAGHALSPAGEGGTVEVLELERGSWAIRMEQDLFFDPLFFRHVHRIGKVLQSFRPDVVHITGPSELGILGAWFAWRLRIPLAASWHTNVHEYAGRRMLARTRQPGRFSRLLARGTEAGSFEATSRFYRLARVLYAPHSALCALLQAKTGRPCHLMQRGVDAELFSPAKRTRGKEGPFRLGYIGRLSVEKNVGLLPRLQKQLLQNGLTPQWVIVGQGTEEQRLRSAFGSDARFTGVLRGEDLAATYADMDLLVFPSHTDTFGNVVLEALASGVPAVVTPEGGPAHIVQRGNGIVADDDKFADAIEALMRAPEELAAMRAAAREYALTCSWDAVFERVLAAYPVS